MSVLLILVVKTLSAYQINSAPSVAVLLVQSQILHLKLDAQLSMHAARNLAIALLDVPPPLLVLAAPALKAKSEIRINQGVSQKEVAPMEIVIALIKVSASAVCAKTFAMTHVVQTPSAPSTTDKPSVNVYKDLSQVLWMQEHA
eukprot:GFUD01047789.1.p2 GENE.GFUD01047789.1~~GFUD01047789.1.p2  ORF type:complete len:144 (+),score=19.41 GFUD01047789.1:269-700(+)